MRLRKYKVQSEVLSSHCVRLYFDYGESLHATFRMNVDFCLAS